MSVDLMAVRCRTSDLTLKVHDLKPCGAERSHPQAQGPYIHVAVVQGCLIELLVSYRELDKIRIREGYETEGGVLSQGDSISAANLGRQTEQD